MSHAAQLLIRAALAVVLLGAMASAGAAPAIGFLYNGHGTIAVVPCGPTCLSATVTGAADDWAGPVSPIPDSWDVLVSQTVDLAAMTFAGTFSFTDVGPGANSFYGSLVGTFVPLSPTQIKGEVMYVVSGGSGIFSGATGSGMSTLYSDLAAGQWVDAGKFDITPVPEPSTVLLLGIGLLGIGVARWRRA